MVVFAPTVKLNNGKEMPVLGLGTWLINREEGNKLIKAAINVGYRHIDTAILYHSEPVIGEAIREMIQDGVIKREDIFLTSKLWCSYAHPGMVLKGCKKTLKNLGLEYLDLFLMHWPFSFQKTDKADEPMTADFQDAASIMNIQEYFPRDSSGKVIMGDNDYLETWKEMERLVEMGLTKTIGVSNFNAKQVDRLLKNCKIKPAILQVEAHPYFSQKKLIQFCKERGVVVTAYSPLGSAAPPNIPGVPKLMEHPTLLKIANETNKSPAQVALRYMIQLGCIVIPKTVNHKRLEENINIFDFKLTPEQMTAMDTLNCNQRIWIIPGTEHHKYFPFDDEF